MRRECNSIVPLGDGLSLAEMAALVESLSLNVQILPVGETWFRWYPE
jgi:hypothetical protein